MLVFAVACTPTPPARRDVVVVLHYLNGLNLAEIAEIVDCPIGTVKSRLHYALRRLRTHLVAHPELGIEPVRPRPATGIGAPKRFAMRTVPVENE